MPSKPPRSPRPPPPERADTNESLTGERKKTDQELAKRRQTAEGQADALVERTRAEADHRLESAREKADHKLTRDHASPEHLSAVQQERAHHDAALREERTATDVGLAGERDAEQQALAALLGLERAQTDHRLLLERSRSDADISSRDEFLGMVSHDLRTLLAGIALSAAIQLKHAGDDERGRQIRRSAERIQHFTARMNRLIGDLVDVASIEAGKLSVLPERRDAARLIRETLEAFQPTASAKTLTLTAELREDAILAEFDHDRILQVLANLLSNAIKFTPEGGTISVRVEPVEGEIRFSVADTGIGVPPEQLAPIFERFWQVTSGDRRGLGLGLFISKCIVEAHAGRIWAVSEVGKGSTFFFTLPRAGRSS